jgi:hypothetical protein
MPVTVFRIEVPPAADGSVVGEDQNAARNRAIQEFLDTVRPTFASMLTASPRRAGNVRRVEVLSENDTDANNFLLLISVDIGRATREWESVLPAGTQVSELGTYEPRQQWPQDSPT